MDGTDTGSGQDAARLDKLLQRLSSFLALFEQAESKLDEREQQLQQQFQQVEERVEQSVTKIQTVLEDCQQIMTDVGVARWRVAAEEAMSQGAEQVQTLQSMQEEFRTLSTQSCDRLEQASLYTVKSVGDAVATLRQADFKKLTEQCCDQIEDLTQQAIKRIHQQMRWSYWRKTLLVFAFSSLVAVTMGLYINDEWPWEEHAEVMQQRDLGQALTHAWPHIGKHDRAVILRHTKHPHAELGA